MKQNHYEMMYILRPDMGEEQVNQAIAKYQDFLKENGATELDIQNRGKRRLAYPIKKFQDGIYVQMNYVADGTQIKPLERSMRLSEEVIRYLTLKLRTPQAAEEEAVAEEAAV